MRGLAIALVLITSGFGAGCKDDSESDRGDGGYASPSAGSGAQDGGADTGAGGSETDAGNVGGVAGDKRLGELSEAETVAICEGLQDTVDTEDTRQGTCVIGASIAVDFAAPEDAMQTCEDQITMCLEAPAELCSGMMFTASCEATVADWSDCLRTAAAQLSALADKTCEEIVADSADSASDGGVTSGLEAELERCSAMLNACNASDDNPCCTEDDACNYADNGFCDCPDQSWDEADCG